MNYYRFVVQRDGQWLFASGYHTLIQGIVMWWRMNGCPSGLVMGSQRVDRFDEYLQLLQEGKPTVAMDIRQVNMGVHFDVEKSEERLMVANSWVVRDAEMYLERLVNPKAARDKDKAARRLLFAKWLVEKGRIGEGLDMVKESE